ncbi:MAG: DUF3592 domain-containing protein [Vicinamibacteraceae bacterium]
MTTEDEGVKASAYGCITIPFLLIACIPLAYGARSSWNKGQLERDGIVVPGRVMELRHVPENPSISSFESGSRSKQSAVATFTTRAGETRTLVSSVNRSPPPWKVGEIVEVAYDPTDPARADLRSELTNWRTWFAIWCAVAALPVTIAFMPVVMAIRRRRKKRLDG